MTQTEFKDITRFIRNCIVGTEFENSVYAVGGSVRDMVAGREIHDIDIVVSLPEGGIKLANWFYENGFTTNTPIIYENFGTAMFFLKEFPVFEIETVHTRKECYRDKNSRNPETAYGTLKEDSERRDFTYNALYYDISNERVLDVNGNSINDLNSNIIRTCGDPDIIFTEDPLRILRAFRFASRFNSTLHPDTVAGIKKYADRLCIISKERICSEISQILMSNNAVTTIKMMNDLGVMRDVFPNYVMVPDLKPFKDSYSLSLRLALIMRLGCSNDEVMDILKNLRFSNDIVDRVKFILDHKSYDIEKIKEIRRIQYECSYYKNIDNSEVRKLFDEVIMFNRTWRAYYTYDIYNVEDIVNKLDNTGTSMWYYTLPIDGVDIMDTFDIKPGKLIKLMLNTVFEEALNNPNITKEECFDIIRKRF